MTFVFKKAKRTDAKLRLGIGGVSNSGKSYSSLLLAKGLGGRIAVVDTERGSSNQHAGKEGIPEFDVLQLGEPFSPERYIEAIHSAEDAGYDVLILDSITHEWAGTGGCLELVDSIAKTKYKGNSWSAWNDITPRHRRFMDAILNSKCHVICTIRSKQDTVQNKDSNGRTRVERVGVKLEQRDGIEYEFSLMFEIGDRDTHTAIASKDRTSLFRDPLIISEETGKKLIKWLSSAEPEALEPQPAEEPVEAPTQEPAQEPKQEPTEDEQRMIADLTAMLEEAKTAEELKEASKQIPKDAPKAVKEALQSVWKKRVRAIKGEA